MKFVYKKRFQKVFAKQSKKVQQKAMDVLTLFQEFPSHPSLHRHALKGKRYDGFESLDVTGDICIII